KHAPQHLAAPPVPPRRSSDLGGSRLCAGRGRRLVQHAEEDGGDQRRHEREPWEVVGAERDGAGYAERNEGLAQSCNHRSLLPPLDRKSTRLNSSHVKISYAVF